MAADSPIAISQTVPDNEFNFTHSHHSHLNCIPIAIDCPVMSTEIHTAIVSKKWVINSMALIAIIKNEQIASL